MPNKHSAASLEERSCGVVDSTDTGTHAMSHLDYMPCPIPSAAERVRITEARRARQALIKERLKALDNNIKRLHSQKKQGQPKHIAPKGNKAREARETAAKAAREVKAREDKAREDKAREVRAREVKAREVRAREAGGMGQNTGASQPCRETILLSRMGQPAAASRAPPQKVLALAKPLLLTQSPSCPSFMLPVFMQRANHTFSRTV